MTVRLGSKKIRAKHKGEFIEFMDALEDYLRVTSKLVPKNAPKGFGKPVTEFQKSITNLINGDMKTARKLHEVVDEHTIHRLDSKVEDLRIAEIVRSMTVIMRKLSK